jgi:hypothetical protein
MAMLIYVDIHKNAEIRSTYEYIVPTICEGHHSSSVQLPLLEVAYVLIAIHIYPAAVTVEHASAPAALVAAHGATAIRQLALAYNKRRELHVSNQSQHIYS